MIDFELNQSSGAKVSSALFTPIVRSVASVLKIKKNVRVSIAIVGEQKIKKLNAIYRGKDSVTDVLSFGEVENTNKLKEGDFLGEVIICYPRAKQQAKQFKHSVAKEVTILTVHSLLHLLGFEHDHQKDSDEMQALEKRILSRL